MTAAPLSVRARIVVGSTAIAVALIAIACVVVYAQISAIAVAREKAVLHGIAEVYGGVIREDPSEPFERPGVDQHVAIVDPDGTIRMNTLPRALRSHVDELTSPGPALREVRFDESYYLYVDVIDTDDGAWTVLVTRDSDIAADVVSEVVRILWMLLVGGALVFAVGSWIISTAALRPVSRLRRSAQRLAASAAPADSELLPVRGSGDEIDTLAVTLNDLLTAVHAAAQREQQMIADASHELRNPLAVLRAQLELVEPADDEAAELLRAALATLNRLIRSAQSMLELSRIDMAPPPQPTPLRALRAEVIERVDHVRWRLAEPSSPQRGTIDLRIDVDDLDARAAVAPAELDQIIDNLVDNALNSTAAHPVHVQVTMRHRESELTLVVEDDGPGFDASIVDRAQERFTRGPDPHYPGGGLGLAIVARIAERAGGSVSIRSGPPGAEVTVRLPTSAEDLPAPNTHQR